MIIQRVWLHQVDDIEAVGLACLRVGNAEVEPLSVATRVIIWLQDQVVLIFVDLNCAPQVTALESRLEKQCHVVRPRRQIERLHFTFDGLTRRFLRVRVGRRVDRIVDYSVHERFLVRDTFSLPA